MLVSSTVINQFDIFRDVGKDELDTIARLFKVKYCSKGQYIIATSRECTDVYFLISGKVRVCFFSENGKPVHFEDLSPGSMFGELNAIDNQGRSSDCISIEDTQLVSISAEHFRSLLVDHPRIMEAVMKRLAQMVRFNMRRVVEFSAFPVSKRVRLELLRLASQGVSRKDGLHITDPPTQVEFAARISTHREAVSRELNALISRGVITWGQSGYVIHDVVALSD